MILHSKRELVMKREGRSWPVDLNKAPSCYEAAILTICHPPLLVGSLKILWSVCVNNSYIFLHRYMCCGFTEVQHVFHFSIDLTIPSLSFRSPLTYTAGVSECVMTTNLASCQNKMIIIQCIYPLYPTPETTTELFFSQ